MKNVTESYSCLAAPDDGAIQDYHARVNGVFVARAAGNAAAPEPVDDVADVCSNHRNAVCVGSTTRKKNKRACYSQWRNPRWLYAPEDREEPDVLAFGGEASTSVHYECSGVASDEVIVAHTSSDFAFGGETGTSFATPAAAALAELTREYCVEHGKPDPRALLLRSWMRTAAHAANPVGWRYSTLQEVFAAGDPDRVGLDHEDGGGFASGATMRKLCSDNLAPDEEVFVGGGMRSSTQGQPASGSPPAEPEWPDVPPGEQSLRSPLAQDLTPAPGLTGWMFDVIETRTFDVGDRLRFTFSWNYCNTASSTGAPPGTTVDFDVFLYNATIGQGLYASQTGDDVNEGFDVIVPEGWAGTYEFLLYWPTGATFCSGGEDTAFTGWIKRAP